MPPLLNQVISGYVGLDNLSIPYTVTDIPVGRTMTKAWLTIKTQKEDADPGILQKVITTAPQAGIGQITDPGASGTGQLLFLIAPSDFSAAALVALVTYEYDIQVKFDDGGIATLELGKITFEQGVTAATS
jgi:hypothetical protein